MHSRLSKPNVLLCSNPGNTLAEYGLVAALILLVTLPGLYLIGNQVQQWSNNMKTSMTRHPAVTNESQSQNQTSDQQSENPLPDSSSQLTANLPVLHKGKTTKLILSDGSIVRIIYDQNTITVSGANGERSVVPFPRSISNPILVFANKQFSIQAGQDASPTQPNSPDTNSTSTCRSVKCYSPGFHPGR